jgi:hypothetical protein
VAARPFFSIPHLIDLSTDPSPATLGGRERPCIGEPHSSRARSHLSSTHRALRPARLSDNTRPSELAPAAKSSGCGGRGRDTVSGSPEAVRSRRSSNRGDAALGGPRARGSATLIMTGDPGIGRSSLLAEPWVSAHDMRVLAERRRGRSRRPGEGKYLGSVGASGRQTPPQTDIAHVGNHWGRHRNGSKPSSPRSMSVPPFAVKLQPRRGAGRRYPRSPSPRRSTKL